jgi:hypothetical protein
MSAATTTGIFTLIGTLGGASVAGLVAGFRTWRDHLHEVRMKTLDHEHEEKIKSLDIQSEAATARRNERREVYGHFLASTDGAYQRAADLYHRRDQGSPKMDFRDETRDVVTELMERLLVLSLVATKTVRVSATEYTRALRAVLVEAVDGNWTDKTSDARTKMFEAMMADVNPDGAPAKADEIPPPPTGATATSSAT